MLAVSLSCGNILKNVFCMPRPASPPVRALDDEHDWGMPSTHTINAITLGGLVLWTMFKINLTLNAQLYFLLGLTVCATLPVDTQYFLIIFSFPPGICSMLILIEDANLVLFRCGPL